MRDTFSKNPLFASFAIALALFCLIETASCIHEGPVTDIKCYKCDGCAAPFESLDAKALNCTSRKCLMTNDTGTGIADRKCGKSHVTDGCVWEGKKAVCTCSRRDHCNIEADPEKYKVPADTVDCYACDDCGKDFQPEGKKTWYKTCVSGRCGITDTAGTISRACGSLLTDGCSGVDGAKTCTCTGEFCNKSGDLGTYDSGAGLRPGPPNMAASTLLLLLSLMLVNGFRPN